MLGIEGYITTFRMDQSNYEFNRVEFISQLKKDFLENIQHHPKYNPKLPGRIPYKCFKELVKDFEIFYKFLSARRYQLCKKNLTDKLWNMFYAKVVVPYRTKHYPVIQKFIEDNSKKD